MESLSLPLLMLIFILAAGMVWWSGVRLSRTTDSLDGRLGLDDAFGGLLILAILTNLPDLAIVTTAAVADDLSIASGSVLGGVAIQAIVLAFLDFRGGGVGVPLTSRTRTLLPALEAVMVIVSLCLVVLGAQLDPITFARVEPVALVILLAWLGALLAVQRANKGMAWELVEDERRPPEGEENPELGSSTRRLVGMLSLAAVLTLLGGFLLERTSSAMASQLGIDGVVFGATILAAATTVPDLATGLQSVKLGNHELVISQVFGSIAFLPVLFLVANLVTGSAVLPNANGSNLYLAAFGVVLMAVYLIGLLVRSARTFLRMGLDSWLVVVTYLVGMYGLVFTD
ncbi:MAG TPA: hypothetical protein VD789_11425 [Thermomicrobiales bacterium]|nr:hypothetical protein [Thermomicrobiales bacterium]